MENRWREILEKIEQGLLSPEEGARLMEDDRPAAAEAVRAAGSPPADDEPPAKPEPDPRLDYWKRFMGSNIAFLKLPPGKTGQVR